jgi:flagellin
MALVINTNIASLTAQRNLAESQSVSATAMERLSSGLRINSARDDAAGLAIANRFTARSEGLAVATRNASDGISLAQTAEGALQEVTDNLLRMRELAVQAANGTLSSADRTALQTEMTQLTAEIDRVATTSNYNGINLLNGSFTAQTFQVGAEATSTVQMAAIASARSNALGQFQGVTYTNQGIGTATNTASALSVTIDGTTTALGNVVNSASAVATALNAAGIGFVATADATTVAGTTTTTAGTANAADNFVINGVTINVTNHGTVAQTNEDRAIAAINAQSAATGVTATDDGTGVALTAADGRNIVVAAGSGALADYGLAAGTTGSTLDITYTAPSGTTGTVAFTNGTTSSFDPTDATIAATGTALNALSVATQGGATTAITSIDAALSSIDTSRAGLGATQSRFDSVVSSTMVARENAEASRSRIMDADFAVETANMTKGQILQQAGISVLAQANAMPQQVLSLLQ